MTLFFFFYKLFHGELSHGETLFTPYCFWVTSTKSHRVTTKHCQHLSHAVHDTNSLFFSGAFECFDIPQLKGSKKGYFNYLLPSNTFLCSSFPITHLLYTCLIKIPFHYHHGLKLQAELFLQLLTSHLKTVSTSFRSSLPSAVDSLSAAIPPHDPMHAASRCCTLM